MSAGALAGETLPSPASTEADDVPAWHPTIAPSSATVSFHDFCRDEALIRSWQELEAAATLPTQSLAFAAALSSTLHAKVNVGVAFARDGDAIAALLPFCWMPRPFARLRIGAEELCEPGDALCRSQGAARLLAEEVVRGSRALDIDRIPSGSPLIPALHAAIRGKGRISVRPATPSPTIALSADWTDPAARFNSGRRSDFRRALRRANELGRVSFEILSPSSAQFDALFDEALKVEVRSWKREAGTAIVLDSAKEAFFREFFRSACDRDEFRIAFMRIDGRAVAMQMALESLGRFWLFKIGFDEEFARCSPGTLLMLETIGWAAKRGLRAYELLGNVEPWIAQLWTREQQDCVRLRTYPYNASGAVAFVADAWAWLRTRAVRAS